MQNLKEKVAKGAIWTLCEKLSTQVVGFVVGMVLARLLTPTDYGTVALMGIFFAVTGVLVDGGFGGALIQKKDADELDFNSVFYLNLVLSLAGYVVLFFAAPWIAKFYETPELTSIVRVAATCFIFNAINAIQNAELTKKMLFHLSFRISLISSATSAIFGITLAYLGFGVWALVYTSLIVGIVGVIARWFIIAWRPKLMFSWSRLKPLFSYGWKMAASALLDQFFVNLNGLLIGKFYTKADLAYVNKGNSLPQLAMNQVDETLGRVSFPAMVLLQDDRAKLREAMRKMIRCSTFLVFPLMVMIAACAKSELRLLYGEQWVPSAPYMMLACFSFALWPFHTINLRGIMAVGRSDIFLKLEIIKKVLRLVVILASFRYGVFVFMAASAFALGPMSVLINAWPNRKLLNYSVGMQVVDVLPSLLLSVAETIAVVGVGWTFTQLGFGFEATGSVLSLAAVLVLQGTVGFAVYFGLSWLFRVGPMADLVGLMTNLPSSCFSKLAAVLQQRILRR